MVTLATAACVAACTAVADVEEDYQPDPTGGGCEPGRSTGCVCQDGRRGAQECRADGRGWTPCVCSGEGEGEGESVEGGEGEGAAEGEGEGPAEGEGEGEGEGPAEGEGEGEGPAEGEGEGEGEGGEPLLSCRGLDDCIFEECPPASEACRQGCYERTGPACRRCREDAWLTCNLEACEGTARALRDCQEEHGCSDYELSTFIDNCASRSCANELDAWEQCSFGRDIDAYLDCLIPLEFACSEGQGDDGPLDCWGVFDCGFESCAAPDDACRQGCYERGTPECRTCLDDAWLTCNLEVCEATTQALHACQEQHGCRDFEIGLDVDNCTRSHCLATLNDWEECRRNVSFDDYNDCYDPRLSICRSDH